ncbi:MAG: hypothetical protein HY043_11015 [Verrucomicrobia bacterium]|nr:hypothetical protein [Verrucomicrobiota bacterium]
MAFLKKLGAFFGNHYEKIILSFVLLLLAGGAAYLPIKLKEYQKQDEIIRTAPPPRPAQAPKPADLSSNETVIARVKTLTNLDLANPHHLFNPVVWKTRGNSIFKIDSSDKEGPGALVISKRTPLNLTIVYNSAFKVGDSYAYQFTIKNEADPSRAKRGNIQKQVSLGAKSDYFTLREVTDPPENPTEVAIDLAGTAERIRLEKGKPFVRVNGYAVDLHYPLEKDRNFLDRRVKDSFELGGEKYNIVAIDENAVTVEANSAPKKRTNIRFNAATLR